MAQIDRYALKALWIDGFIPDQDDYADFFDSFLAFYEGSTDIYYS